MTHPAHIKLGLFTLSILVIVAVLTGLLWPSTRARWRPENHAVTAAAINRQRATETARSADECAETTLIDRRAAEVGRKGSGGCAINAASQMPDSADLVAVFQRAAALRETPLGRAAAKFFSDAAGLKQSRDAWSSLAGQLGWSETEMFDRLLGKRVVLVARAASDGSGMLWALLSDVSPETDQRLKQRLEASQRAIDQGHQILSIEKGRFELTSHRRDLTRREAAEAAQRGTPAEATVTLVLGPAGRSELFDEMVRVLAQGAARPMHGQAVLEEAGKFGACDVLVLAKVHPGERAAPVLPSPAPPADTASGWSDFLAFALKRTELDDTSPAAASELEARIIYRDRRDKEALLSIPAISDSAFQALAPGSLLTIVQAASLQPIVGQASPMLDMLRELPLPETARGALGNRQVLSLRPIEQRLDSSPEDPDLPMPAPPVRCGAVLALEATSTPDLARALDGAIARFVHSLEQGGGTVQPTPFDFGGDLPGVTRVLPVRSGEGNLVRLITSDPITFAWSYPAAPGLNAGPAPGWWVLGIAPTTSPEDSAAAAFQRDLAAAIARPVTTTDALGHTVPACRNRRWVWLGSARPAALESLLPPIIPDAGGFRTAMQRLDRLRVELSISDAGDVQGDVAVKLAETAPRTAPTAQR